MSAIGFNRAYDLMKEQGWKMYLTMRTGAVERIEVHDPNTMEYHPVRIDSGLRLAALCEVTGHDSDSTAILSFDHTKAL